MDFPALAQRVHGKRLVYLDSAATAQTPTVVVEALRKFHAEDCANIHRGVHTLSARATAAYEAARDKVARFIGARRDEIVFTRGTTESINLVAHGLRSLVGPGDRVVVSEMEHHSNLVPWQVMCQQTGATLVKWPLDDAGDLQLERGPDLLRGARIIAVAHVSNALGTVNPVAEICGWARDAGAISVVDGAQAVPHMPVDVAALGADFYAFSGHKLYGPTGIGVLYGRHDVLRSLPPYQTGGGMIRQVSFEGTTYVDAPERFEAGTPNIAGAIGLGAAIDYVGRIGMEAVARHGQGLLETAITRLARVPRLRFVGTAKQRSAVCSFVFDDIHPHDVGTVLDTEGVAVRTGHHCAQPVMARYGVPATVRASFAFYNTEADVAALVDGLMGARELMGV